MPLALVVLYNKLVKFLSEVGIGTLKSVRESFVLIWSLRIRLKAVTECLVRLASFYLTTLKAEDFDWFRELNTFQVAIGGDGPLWKI